MNVFAFARASAPAHARRHALASFGKEHRMRYAGLLVMPAGFILSVAALILFPAPATRMAFVLCGLAVEALGLVVATRGAVRR
jgi:hypothetical protein